jgi:small GTP-binding protein
VNGSENAGDTVIRRNAPKCLIKALAWSVLTLQENVAYLFKIVFLGEGAVGKTSLVGRYVYDSFEGDYLATIGTDIHVKIVDAKDAKVKLVIWDIAGQDNFAQLRRAYYQNASGAFFVYDTTRSETLERMKDWINALYSVTGEIPLVILENKTDLESEIKDEDREAIASKYDTPILKTSAKEDVNVEEAFREVTGEILKRARERKSASKSM